MNYVIQVSNLKKSYGNNKVLKDLSFNVKKGEIFGILGVNDYSHVKALVVADICTTSIA